MHCSGSFLLHDLFLNLHEFASFQGQNMKLNVNMLLTCILHCAPGPAVIRTVCKYSRQFLILLRISYLFSYDFLWRRRSFTARKLHVSRFSEGLVFLADIRSSLWLCFSFSLLDLFGRSGTTLLKSSCLHALHVVQLFRHDKFSTNDFDKLTKRTLTKISSFSMKVLRIACSC